MRTLILFLFFIQLGAIVNSQELTYYGNVKKIIDDKCLSCHRESGYAPFKLDEYDDIAKRSKFIRFLIESNVMPPWKANAHYRDFANNKSLNNDEKQLIIKWIDNGCLKGKEIAQFKKPVYAAGSQLNLKANLVLKMKAPFEVPPLNQNVYICYKIPFEISHDTFARAIEFVAGNKSVVHHASYQILEVEEDVDIYGSPDYFRYDEDTLNRVNDAHDHAFFNLIGKSGNPPKETYHGGWLPGTTAQLYPSPIGIRIPKKGVILIRNFHYSPTPIPQSDLSYFNIYYAKKRTTRTLGFASFKPKNPAKDGRWILQANDSSFEAHINVKFYNDVSLININPHMHRLGKYFKAYAVTPQNDTIPLVEIKDWDFNWQEFYRFKKMIKIPAGSVLRADAIYDNSTKNEDNPYNPPQDIKFEWGMNDDSEMMRLVLLYLPYIKGDENISLK